VLPTKQGAIRLFRFAGISVFLHWSWFLVAAYEIQMRTGSYSSRAWNALEYVSLFAIVTMHEFGHALACRSVGGRADQIVLWPLGGVAYVDPPPRPGAVLWSIAAGPLVNALLFVVLTPLWIMSRTLGWLDATPNVYGLLYAIWIINLVLLVFNLLPVYPLDGGQILRALLWFAFGRARSLMIATIIGFVGVAGLIGLAVWRQNFWLGVLAAFILTNCWRGWQQARALLSLAKAPRHDGFACPSCKAVPPAGEFWVCGQCHKPFDTFATQGTCPHCSAQYVVTRCLECGASRPLSEWAVLATHPPAA
jgi:Zn-dependent protease